MAQRTTDNKRTLTSFWLTTHTFWKNASPHPPWIAIEDAAAAQRNNNNSEF